MKNLFKQFLTKSFIVFFIIGVLTTLIHLFIYNITFEKIGVLTANTIAFIVSSLFSYLTNARFSFGKKTNHTSFWLSMFTFLLKLLASNGLTLMFEKILISLDWSHLIKLIPIPVTCILFPIQFIVFHYIFKISKNRNIEETHSSKP